MSASKRKRIKELADKREAGGFVALAHTVLQAFGDLSPRASKLMLDLLAQYRGENNGDLCAAMTLMRPRGWASKSTLAAALTELEYRRFIVRTRQGGRHKASLYAVTFFEIDFCGGKLDIPAPNRSFMGTWRGVSSAPPLGHNPIDYPACGAKGRPPSTNCPAGSTSQGGFSDLSAPQAGTLLELPLPAALIREQNRCTPEAYRLARDGE